MTRADSHDPSDALLIEWLAAHRAGKRAECNALLQQHPECAAAVAEFAGDYESVDERFSELRRLLEQTPRSAAEVATLGSGDTAVPQLKAGSTFGDYELLSEIVRGGMGVVYKARQRSLNRVVALKMVLGDGRTATNDRDRFLVEARAVARLNHPHIVPIYEVGEHKGQPYFTMEFFSGGSLRERMEELRGDQRATAKMMVVVARAVEHAHRRGILHRDLKPSNVLLDERREPHVTDFGLAKRLDEDSDLTQAGAIVGTPSYMAPEQANAQTDLTTAVDVYGLGAVLYELLTGRPPFKGNTPMETMIEAMSREPQRPRKLSPSIDPDLETICLKCLEKDPLARYGSAEALADDLSRWLDGQPIHARPASTRERLVKWARRQPLLAGSAATIALAALVLLILVGSLWQNAELRAQAVQKLSDAKTELAQVDGERKAAEKERSQAQKLADEQRKLADSQKALADNIGIEVDRLERTADAERLKADEARTAAAAALADLARAQSEAQHTLYAADMQLAHAAWQTDNLTDVTELLQRYQQPAGDDPRGFEWHYLWRRSHGARLEWNVRAQPSSFQLINSLALSPDGKTLASFDFSKDILLWDALTGKLLKTIPIGAKPVAGNPPFAVGLRFTDDGHKLVAAIYKYDVIRENADVIAAALRKDKLDMRRLQDQLELRTWDLTEDLAVEVAPFELANSPVALCWYEGLGLRIQHEGEPMLTQNIASSPDGKFLAFVGWPLRLPEKDAVSPLDQFLSASGGGRLIVWDVAKARVHAIQNAPMPISAVAFSPDGTQLAIGSHGGAIGVGTPDADKPPRLFLGHRGNVGVVRFSGDGSRLFSGAADGPIIEWDVATGKEITRRIGHTSAVLRLDLSTDGKTLVSGGEDGSIKIWELNRSDEPTLIRGHETAIVSLAFADNGRELTSVDGTGALKTWGVTDGKLLQDSKVSVTGSLVGFVNNSQSLAWKSTYDSTFGVQSLTTGKDTRLTWKDNFPSAVALSPDDKWAAAGNSAFSNHKSSGMAVWDAAEGKQVAFLHENGETWGLTFTADNKRLIAAHVSGVILWDWQANQVERLEPKGSMNLVAVSKDGKLLAGATVGAVGRQAVVRIWDLKTNELQVEFRGAGGQVRQLAFTPDGRRLATVGETSFHQPVLKLWDTTSGREVFTAALPPGTITALAFSPDGNLLAAATQANDPTAPLEGRKIPGEIDLWDATPTFAAEPTASGDAAKP